jgi:hypothetical protein
MYTAITLILVSLAGFLVVTGVKRRRTLLVAGGVLVGAAVLFLFSILSVWCRGVFSPPPVRWRRCRSH